MISPVQQGHLRAVSAQEDGLSKWTARRDAWSVDFQDSCLGKTTPAEKERERERERQRDWFWSWAHTTVSSFSGSYAEFAPRLWGVWCGALALLVHQLFSVVSINSNSRYSLAHISASAFGFRPETAKKNWPSLQDTWIWISAGFRTFALCLLSPDHYTREDSARMPTQNVSRACSLWPWPTLWVSVCLIGKWANLLPRHNNVLKLKCSIM